MRQEHEEMRGSRGARRRLERAPLWLALMACGLLLAALPPVASAAGGKKSRGDELEERLPDKYRRSPYSLMSLSVGYPNDGFQLRAKKLRSTPHLKVRNQELAYGHPALVLMLKRSARDISRTARGSVMLVGDLSKKYGGPLAGHRSHQSGRDADVAFYMLKDGKPVQAPRLVAFDGNGKAKDGSGYEFDDYRNWLLVQSWVEDRRAGISHVFCSRPLRERLLAYAAGDRRFKKHLAAASGLLKQPARSSAHDDHFHVRIDCPKRQEGLCKTESRRR